VPRIQPVNVGATWSGDDKVVAVDGGTGPVNESTNVSYPLFPVSVRPTATQSDTHDTEDSLSKVVPAFGLDTIDHTVPSQTITNVSVAEPVSVEPTATHSATLTHDTEYSASLMVPAFGLDTIDHTVPSHTITNVP
jgi:hypothetical protein